MVQRPIPAVSTPDIPGVCTGPPFSSATSTRQQSSPILLSASSAAAPASRDSEFSGLSGSAIDVYRPLIISNCELISPYSPIKLATTLGDDRRWTAHATCQGSAGLEVILSATASSGALSDAFEALHRKSSDAVKGLLERARRQPPPPPPARRFREYEELSADEESDDDDDDDDAEDDDDLPTWGSYSEPYPCCGWDGPQPRTRLLPVTRRPRAALSCFPPPPPPPPPPASPSPPPPPPPPPAPASRFTPSRPASSPALLVISMPDATTARLLTSVSPSQRAIERAALRYVRDGMDDPGPEATAVVRSVGMGDSEAFEVEGLGDDLSAVFEGALPRIYVEVRAVEARGGPPESQSLLPPGRDHV